MYSESAATPFESDSAFDDDAEGEDEEGVDVVAAAAAVTAVDGDDDDDDDESSVETSSKLRGARNVAAAARACSTSFVLSPTDNERLRVMISAPRDASALLTTVAVPAAVPAVGRCVGRGERAPEATVAAACVGESCCCCGDVVVVVVAWPYE